MAGDHDPFAAVSVLSEPMRRRVYAHAIAVPGGVTRDSTAAALGVTRSVAAFHLDKIAAAGLLAVDFRRPPGRSGPGAGRPTKWYRRASREITVSMPPRRYDLAAALLASAIKRAAESGQHVAQAVSAVAREHGYGLWARLTGRSDENAPAQRQRLMELLVDLGYEPQDGSGTITMTNCPFHALTAEHRDLACAMNHDLLRGVAEAAGLPACSARLDPGQDRCCVVLDIASPAA